MTELVEHLTVTWASIDALCEGLTEDEWKRPTGCPGWSVQDNLSHLVDYEATVLGRPRPDHTVGEVAHARNEMGAINEVGVDLRRSQPGAAVLAEFREVTAERAAVLGRLGPDDLRRETETPIGKGTVEDLLTLRVMDTWSHEQDMRRALGRPGHLEGPVPATAVRYWSQFLGFVVGKKAGAPDGTTAVFHVGELPSFTVGVDAGRGALVDASPASPTVELRCAVGDFAALVNGRADARPDAVEVTGDVELGRRIVAELGFMP